MEDEEMRARVAHMETLLEQVEALPDARARALAEETMRALVQFYGEGLARIMEQVAQVGGADALRALAADELVSHMLLLHGLHPVDVETRVATALEELRPYLRLHGGNVEFLGIAGAKARLRLQGTCQGGASAATTLQRAIAEAIATCAPDLEGIETEDAAPPRPGPRPVTFVPRASRAGKRVG